jgi:hypothetical protein
MIASTKTEENPFGGLLPVSSTGPGFRRNDGRNELPFVTLNLISIIE